MALKGIGVTLGLIPVVVSGEEVGTGDGTEKTFTLDYNNVRAGTLVVYFDGTPTESFTPNLAEGTFVATPGDTVAVTADYISGPDTNILEAGEGQTVLVFNAHVGNKDGVSDATLTLWRKKAGGSEKYYSYDVNIPVHSTYKPVSGTIVLEAGDELHAYASAINAIDLNLEYKV